MKIDGKAFLVSAFLAAPAVGLTNPTFLINDPTDPDFGWETRGSVSVSNGAALLQEDDRLLTRLAQTFVIPEGAQTLRFTLSASLTDRDPLQPPDAFEVALLDTTTLSPLTGTASGLANTDALLNLQPNGELFVAPRVTVPETISFPLTVEVDLRNVPPGTRATLSFDLLGFRPAGSSVTVDNVFISREGAVSSVVEAGGPYSAVIGETVSFDGSGSSDADGPIVLYEWDFEGDGIFDSSSGEPTATHTYSEAGTFTATLRVTDDTGLISIDTASVEVRSLTRPPVCPAARPSIASLWPPNHKFVSIKVLGVTDPDGDPVRIRIDRIRQDEPLNGTGDGDTSPDGSGIGTDTARVRAERAGTGNGRVYHIFFTAEDGRGGSCSGEVLVGVPHDQGQGKIAVDDGPLFDSTVR